MNISPAAIDRVRRAVSRDRLLDTAVRLIAVPSPTGSAGGACDACAEILQADGFAVRREAAGHPTAPAVLARLDSGKPGRTLQFDGHLDVVHLPFVPPKVEGNRLTGSGSADMKAGTAAAVEGLRALRETGLLERGGVLFCAHDLHEAPWGFGEQLDALVRAGLHGDAVLIPEYQRDSLPVTGRGAAVWKVHLRRPGAPVHEVLRPREEPSVIAAGAELVAELGRLEEGLRKRVDPVAGAESVFIGQIHSGEIYNQYPQECWLQGTRRWLPDRDRAAVEADFRRLVDEVASKQGVTAELEYQVIRDAFRLDVQHPFVAAFQDVQVALEGKPLPTGPKPFVDDGNSFWGLAKVPAITHGPRGGGAHTVNEWVDVDDLVRVAVVYALAALAYCNAA